MRTCPTTYPSSTHGTCSTQAVSALPPNCQNRMDPVPEFPSTPNHLQQTPLHHVVWAQLGLEEGIEAGSSQSRSYVPLETCQTSTRQTPFLAALTPQGEATWLSHNPSGNGLQTVWRG